MLDAINIGPLFLPKVKKVVESAVVLIKRCNLCLVKKKYRNMSDKINIFLLFFKRNKKYEKFLNLFEHWKKKLDVYCVEKFVGMCFMTEILAYNFSNMTGNLKEGNG